MKFNSNLALGVQGKRVDIHERKRWADLENTVNTGIEFGAPGSQGNIKGTWATVTAPATPDTDFTIDHNLGVTPVGVDVKQKDRACDVYTGSSSATKSQITLRSTIASAKLVLFIH